VLFTCSHFDAGGPESFEIDGSDVSDEAGSRFIRTSCAPGGYGHVSTVESNTVDLVDVVVHPKHIFKKMRQVETLRVHSRNCRH
jgi:hypothetical protein